MAKTSRYGAVSFLDDRHGPPAVIAAVKSNNIVGAIARAGDLMDALMQSVKPKVGAVAFELVTDSETNEERLNITMLGDVPAENFIRASILNSLAAKTVVNFSADQRPPADRSGRPSARGDQPRRAARGRR